MGPRLDNVFQVICSKTRLFTLDHFRRTFRLSLPRQKSVVLLDHETERRRGRGPIGVGSRNRAKRGEGEGWDGRESLKCGLWTRRFETGSSPYPFSSTKRSTSVASPTKHLLSPHQGGSLCFLGVGPHTDNVSVSGAFRMSTREVPRGRARVWRSGVPGRRVSRACGS